MDPLEQAKKLREEYERALDAAESRRTAYHEAVLELHRSGTPLREIAKELGLSHQRVHQIVSGESPRRRNLGRVAGGIGGLLVLIAAIAAAVWIQSYQPLAFGRLDVVPSGSYNTIGEKGQVAWVGYRKGIGGGPNRPFFAVTLQNTGPFTVRLERPTYRYGPDLPVLRGWSSRLLMARYTRVKETNPVLARRDHGYTWRRGPLQPYQPVSLAPGQIVMIAYQGVWHDCQLELPVGASTPPTTFPISYSFLWKTATARIPFPGGLTIDPPNHHANQDCRRSSRTGSGKSPGKHSA
jgi:hypothetical protein